MTLDLANGCEGVAVTGQGTSQYIYVAFDREWAQDPEGQVRIGRYSPFRDEWRFFFYPLSSVQTLAGGWGTLSEIVALSDEQLMVVECDDAAQAHLQRERLYTVRIADVEPALEHPIPVLSKTLVRNADVASWREPQAAAFRRANFNPAPRRRSIAG